MHGYSLEAQREALTKYAKEHNMFIVDYYVDEGKSARKRYTSRREFMRMLDDVRQGKLDIILFIKLDRWFRSISDYYKVQEILDDHKVSWRTTEEQYDTTTTNGRLYTNIRLSLAQDEADRTSDRIKFVFAAKLARSEALTGKMPLGLKVVDKHIVLDPDKADIVREMFRHYAEHGSKHGTVQHIYNTYGLEIDRHNFQKMLRNPLYKGEYRGIAGYCEPLIDPALFDRINAIPNARTTPRGRIYIFAGLIVCAECGSHMNARYSTNKTGQAYVYYRCNRYSNYKSCTNTKMVNETMLEDWLLENVEDEINKFLVNYTAKAKAEKRRKPSADRATIRRKLDRLRDLYVDDLIDKASYKAEYDRYTAQLAEIPPEPEKPKVDIQALQNFLKSNFKSTYSNLDRERRRTLWRGIIREIKVSSQKDITISFTQLSY